jgi:hypothetical protein
LPENEVNIGPGDQVVPEPALPGNEVNIGPGDQVVPEPALPGDAPLGGDLQPLGEVDLGPGGCVQLAQEVQVSESVELIDILQPIPAEVAEPMLEVETVSSSIPTVEVNPVDMTESIGTSTVEVPSIVVGTLPLGVVTASTMELVSAEATSVGTNEPVVDSSVNFQSQAP